MFSKVLTDWLLRSLCLVLVFQKFVAARVSPNETTLIFYYGPQFTDSMVYQLSDANQILKNPNFTKKETHLYLHGWNESQHSESVHLIVDSYLKRKDINIVTVDWAKAAGEEYVHSLENVKELAPVLSDVIVSLYNAGIARKSFTVVSHSLGCQLTGMAGQHMIQKSNGTLKIYKFV